MAQTPMDGDFLQELSWSFAAHRVLTTAARTGILDALSKEALTAPKIASRLDLAELPAKKILGALEALGAVERSVDDTFRLVASLAPMFAEGASFSAFLEHSHSLYDSWGENLEPWLRGAEWGFRQRDPNGIAKFQNAMRGIGTQVARDLAHAVDLSGHRRLVDLGGGVGHYAEALCRASSALHAVVVDLPDVAQLGRERLAGTDLETRISFAGGDYIADSLGGGFDLALLANVVHQEPSDRAFALVERAFRELVPSGRLLIVDFALEGEPTAIPVGALFSINMRSRGETYSEAAMRDFTARAGFVAFERLALGRHRAIFCARKPE